MPIDLYADKSFESSYFSGTGYAFRRGAMLGGGLFPELLYMHYEEVELAYRIIDQGGKVSYRPELRILHHANPVSRRGEVQTFYKPRNQILLAVRCFPPVGGFLYVCPRLVYSLLQSVRIWNAKPFARAVVSAVRLVPECLRQRRCLRADTWRKLRDLHRQSAC
jgi:GT2 family glycosyltransferase